MGEKTKEKNYSIGDHIFAILVVLLMCLFLISSPFLIFFGVFKLVALAPDVSINTKGTFDSVIVLFQVFCSHCSRRDCRRSVFSDFIEKTGVSQFCY